MGNRRAVYYSFWLILIMITSVLCEIGFRAYDHFTMPQDNLNMDVWIRNVSGEVQEHPLLGYRYPPLKIIDTHAQADEFGMRNAKEALGQTGVEIVGVGDSYMDNAHRVFYDAFHAHDVKYHSLAIFGYGPAHYNVLMREFGAKLHPKVYVYSTYLGNDPGDIRRYEAWRASGKEWYAHNGGYVFPIERQGLVWGWKLFVGRAKSFARNLISRMSSESYETFKGFVKQDDVETVFEYVVQAKEIADKQQAKLLVVIIPRTENHKHLLDPIASKLVNLCIKKDIDCLDLDPSFGSESGRGALFAPDGHWNEAGMEVAWKFMWKARVASLLSADRPTQ